MRSVLLLAASLLLTSCAPAILSTEVTAPEASGGFVWWMTRDTYAGGTQRTRVYMCAAEARPPCVHVGAPEASGEQLRDWIQQAQREQRGQEAAP